LPDREAAAFAPHAARKSFASLRAAAEKMPMNNKARDIAGLVV
jgi:hypothetical protein